jgi:hypothetical protein
LLAAYAELLLQFLLAFFLGELLGVVPQVVELTHQASFVFRHPSSAAPARAGDPVLRTRPP